MATQLTLPDGRNLDYDVSGAANGFPLVWSHGNPGAWNPVPHLEKACEKNGFALIGYSRPGFGGSTRRRERNVADIAEDVRSLLTHLGHNKFASGGWSAGGPFSLACGAKLEGCVASIVVAGLAPSDAEGLTWQEGISKGKSEEELVEKYKGQRQGMLDMTAAQIIEECKPEVDKQAAIELDGLAQFAAETFHEAVKFNVDGMVDDDLSFFKPWGFDVANVKVPVFLYHGTSDPSVPFNHAQWVASQLKNVTTHFEEGGGHISAMRDVEQMLKEIKQSI